MNISETKSYISVTKKNISVTNNNFIHTNILVLLIFLTPDVTLLVNPLCKLLINPTGVPH